MALTSTQQKQYDILGKAVSDAITAKAAADAAYSAITATYQQCYNHSPEVGENSGPYFCSTQQLLQYRHQYEAARSDASAKAAAVVTAQQALNEFDKAVTDANTASEQALHGDAGFNLSSQQIASEAKGLLAKAQSSAMVKKIIVIGSIVLGSGLVIGLIIWIVKRSAKKATS